MPQLPPKKPIRIRSLAQFIKEEAENLDALVLDKREHSRGWSEILATLKVHGKRK